MNKVNYFVFKSTAAAAGIALVYTAYEVAKVVGQKVSEKREEKKTS